MGRVVGFGDEIMGSGFARGARARGKRIAFGDGRRIIWHRNAHEIYRGNPNVASPGSEGADDLEWITHYPGARAYCRMVPGRRWQFTAGAQRRGELFFSADEIASEERIAPGFVLIEPNVKPQAPNKQWPVERYQRVADALLQQGRVAQFTGAVALAGVERIETQSFRHAAAILARASLFIGPEGGLHHVAAALGIPAVVIFGGFISPEVTGYDTHMNIFSGNGLGCGKMDPCAHCRAAMAQIGVDEVLAAAKLMVAA